MRRKMVWALAVVALVATPAIVGLVVVRGDDSGSRRAAALVAEGSGAGYELVVAGLTPPGQAADVLSYSWGVTANATAGATGLTSGKPQFSDLQITKKIDTTSPLFIKGAATGQHYASAKLTIYKSPGGKPIEYAVYQMTGVLITAVQHSGSSNDVPSEQVTLAYEKLQVTVKDLDDTGRVTGQTTVLYDLATGKT